MKKFLCFCVIILVFGLTQVYAMTENELFEKLTQSYNVNGVTFQVTDSQRTLIERYLNQYDVSSNDADYIVMKLEEVFGVLKSSGKTSFYSLSSSEKKKIVSIVSDVASNTSVDVAIVDGELVVYVPNTNRGEIFYETPVHPTKNGEITQTGRTLTMAGLGVFAVLGISLGFRKIRNA